MAFDATPGGDPRGPWCKACRRPIGETERSMNVRFDNDVHDLSGLYHEACGRPFASMARVLNLKPWSR